MVSPSPYGAGQRAAFLRSILSASTSRKAGDRKAREIVGDAVGIGDDAVAHAEGALGRFDDAMDVLEAFGLLHAQPVEQREDDERGQPLRRRRRVVERAGACRARSAAPRPRRGTARGRRASPGCRCARDRRRARARHRRDRNRRARHSVSCSSVAAKAVCFSLRADLRHFAVDEEGLAEADGALSSPAISRR